MGADAIRHPRLVLNPRAGGGRARRALARAEAVLREAGVRPTVVETRCAGHAREIARGLPAGEADALVVLGGDGTIHEVVDGLMARDDPGALPLGVLPGGTGNSLAHDLGLVDPEVAARRLLTGRPRPLDLLAVTGPGGTIHAFNVVGWGLALDAGRTAESLRWLGSRRYTLASVLAVLAGRRRTARLSVGERAEAGEWALVLACNTRHTGAGMEIAPRARLDDGLCDLVVVPRMGRLRLLALLRRLDRGGQLDESDVRIEQVARFSLAPMVPGPLNIDGEIAGRTPIEVAVVPGALRLIR